MSDSSSTSNVGDGCGDALAPASSASSTASARAAPVGAVGRQARASSIARAACWAPPARRASPASAGAMTAASWRREPASSNASKRADVVGDRVQRLAVAGDRVGVSVEVVLQHAPAFDAQVRAGTGARASLERRPATTRRRRRRTRPPAPASARRAPAAAAAATALPPSGIRGERAPCRLQHPAGRPASTRRAASSSSAARRAGLPRLPRPPLEQLAIGARVLFGCLRHRLTHLDDVGQIELASAGAGAARYGSELCGTEPARSRADAAAQWRGAVGPWAACRRCRGEAALPGSSSSSIRQARRRRHRIPMPCREPGAHYRYPWIGVSMDTAPSAEA